MKSLRVGRALTDEEIDEVIQAAEHVDVRTAVIVALMARCGLRVGEALAVLRRDVDLDAGRLTVARSLSRDGVIRPVKGRLREDEGRVVPIPADALERLWRHLSDRAVTGIGGYLVTPPR
jgi:integrase